MKKVTFPYGKTNIEYEFEASQLSGVLISSIEQYVPKLSEEELERGRE